MASSDEACQEFVPVLVVAGAEPSAANGEYIPTRYEDLADGYLGEQFAAASGRPAWQRTISDNEFYILLYCSKKLPHVQFNAWRLYKCDNGGGSVLYTSAPVLGRYIPPQTDWRHNSQQHDPLLCPPAPSFSLVELPALVVRINNASEAGDNVKLECIGALSGETIASMTCTTELVKDVKNILALQQHCSIAILLPSGEQATWKEDLMPVREFLEGQPADVYVQRHMMLESLRQGESSFNDLAPDQQADRDVVLASLAYDGKQLESVPSNFRNDREVVMAAVQCPRSGCALAFASSEVCSDRDVVLTALKDHGMALQYASAELRDNKDMVLIALEGDGKAFQFASEQLRSDPLFVKKAIDQDSDAFEYALGDAKANTELAFLAKVDSMKMDTLREELGKRGLPQEGNRFKLRERLKEAIVIKVEPSSSS